MGVEKRLECRMLPKEETTYEIRSLLRRQPFGWRRFFFARNAEGEPADAGRLNEGSNIEPVKKIYAVIGTMLLIIMLWSWQCVL